MSESSERLTGARVEIGLKGRRGARGPQGLLRLQLENLKRAADRHKAADRHVLLRAVDDAERRLAAS